MRKLRVKKNEKVEKTRYDILGPNEYGRFLLYRQPDGWIVDSGEDFKTLQGEQWYIERRLHLR